MFFTSLRRTVIALASLATATSCLPEDLSLEEAAEAPPQFPAYAYAAQQLEVRELPDTNAQTLAYLPQGIGVAIGTCGQGWCGIATSEVFGYVEEAHLSDEPPPTQGTQTQTAGRGYWNSQGEWVQSPTWTADGSAPAGATARCRDGSYSFSNTRRGTCSWHGGVASWLPRAETIRRE